LLFIAIKIRWAIIIIPGTIFSIPRSYLMINGLRCNRRFLLVSTCMSLQDTIYDVTCTWILQMIIISWRTDWRFRYRFLSGTNRWSWLLYLLICLLNVILSVSTLLYLIIIYLFINWNILSNIILSNLRFVLYIFFC